MTNPSLSSSASVSTSLSSSDSASVSTSATSSPTSSATSSATSATSSSSPGRSFRTTVIGTIARFFFACIQPCTDPTPATSPANTPFRDHIAPEPAAAPPRSGRRIVIGTIFGHRGGRHVWFSVQNERLSTEPALLLKLSIPMSTLVREMKTGVVRVGLDFNAAASAEPEVRHCHLHYVPFWTLFCNGRKLGSALRQKATRQNRDMLKSIQNVTTGAGVLPCGSEEVIYVRANFECVVGNMDSESFHLVGPDQGLGEGLSVFLKRTR